MLNQSRASELITLYNNGKNHLYFDVPYYLAKSIVKKKKKIELLIKKSILLAFILSYAQDEKLY